MMPMSLLVWKLTECSTKEGKQGSDGKGKEWWNNMWQFVVAVVVEKAAVVTRDSFAEVIVTGVENVQRRRTSLL